MDKNLRFVLLLFIGFALTALGTGYWQIWVFSAAFVGTGLNWIAASFVFLYVNREVTSSGFALALLLGVIGIVLWLLVEPEREQIAHNQKKAVSTEQTQRFRCIDCSLCGFSSCPRGGSWAEALPCPEIELKCES